MYKFRPNDNHIYHLIQMDSSQIQKPQIDVVHNLHRVISIDEIQSLVDTLVRSWARRQRWKQFFLHYNCQINGLQDHAQMIKRAPWRTHLANFLESTSVHGLSLLLLLLDLVFTVLDLSSSLISCSLSNTYKRENKETGQPVYHWGGIVILVLLSAKALALAVALGWSFFRRPGRVVDAVVVMVALVFELVLKREEAGLLVVVSLWRVVRLVESAFALSDEAIERKIEEIVSQLDVLRGENQSLQEAINEKERRILELEAALDQAVCAG